MKDLLRSRKSVVGGLAVLGGLGVVLMFVVLPAFATSAGAPILPPSIPKNITPIDEPTGGQSNDCDFFYSASGYTKNGFTEPTYQYRISNPKSGPYKTTVGPNKVPVSFTLQMNPSNPPPGSNTPLPAYTNDKYVSFTSTGAAIVDVGIKGGTDTARYNYDNAVTGLTNTSYGSVTADGYLHAPAQSANADGSPAQLYSVSNLTFCFELGASVSGTVYGDANQNGSKDSGESGQSGWTVNLYAGASVVQTTTSASDGSYSFSVPQSSSTTYTICEAPPSGAWAQTQPSPTSPDLCTGTNELPKGYTFTASQSVAGDDFGNVPATACTQPMGFTNDNGVSFQVQLFTCKQNQFVFNSGTFPGGQLWVSVFEADQTLQKVPDVEKITFPFGKSTPVGGPTAYRQNPYSRQSAGTANPTWDELRYDDTFPFSQADEKPMLICNLDPRVAGQEFQLQTSPVSYGDINNAGLVIPNYPTETSCLILSMQAPGKYTAYVYSSLDGLRGVAP